MEIKLNIALQGSVITVQIFMLENINMIGTLKIAQDNLACTFGYFWSNLKYKGDFLLTACIDLTLK